MSHYHHFCLAFSDLSGEVYTSSGAIVLSLTNGADGDRTVLTPVSYTHLTLPTKA